MEIVLTAAMAALKTTAVTAIGIAFMTCAIGLIMSVYYFFASTKYGRSGLQELLDNYWSIKVRQKMLKEYERGITMVNPGTIAEARQRFWRCLGRKLLSFLVTIAILIGTLFVMILIWQ